MDLLACRGRDEFLPILSQHDALFAKFRKLSGNSKNIPVGHVGLKTEKEIRRTKMKEMQCVRL